MVEDYRIKYHTGRAELTGQYTVNRRGNTKAAIPIADIGMHRITKVPMDLWTYR